GGDEQHAAHVRLACRLQQVDGAKDVDARVEERVRHRPPHVHLRGVEVQHGGTLVAHQLGDLGTDDGEPIETGLRVQGLGLAGREVVDDDDVVPGGEVGVD